MAVPRMANSAPEVRVLRVLLSLAALFVGATAALAVGQARADSPIYSYSARPSTTKAGGHPDLVDSFSWGTTYTPGIPNTMFVQRSK